MGKGGKGRAKKMTSQKVKVLGGPVPGSMINDARGVGGDAVELCGLLRDDDGREKFGSDRWRREEAVFGLKQLLAGSSKVAVAQRGNGARAAAAAKEQELAELEGKKEQWPPGRQRRRSYKGRRQPALKATVAFYVMTKELADGSTTPRCNFLSLSSSVS